MALKVFLKFPPTLVLVHGWLSADMRGDWDDSTMSQQLQAPTVYWQATVPHNVVGLPRGGDVTFV